MTHKTLQSLSLLLPVILGALVIGNVTVRASSAGPDTIVVSPSNVTPGPGGTTPFTQDVVISYSANGGGAYPKIVSLQYVVVYDSAVIDVDNSVCATSTDGATYCGVTADAYAQMFGIQQLPQNNPCGPNFCANIQTVSGSIKQVFVASIATLSPTGGLASAGGTHATIHWMVVSGNGKTGIDFSGPDTFYSTSSTSAIDAGQSQIFYTATNGSFDNTAPVTGTADLRVGVSVSPQFVFTNQDITINSVVANNGSQPGSGMFTLTYGGNTLLSQAIDPLAPGGQVFFTTNYNVGTNTGTFAVTGTVSAVGFTDPSPSDNAQTVNVNVRAPPSFTVTLANAKPSDHRLSLSKSHFIDFTAKINFTGRPYVYVQYTMSSTTGPLPTITTGVFRLPNFVSCVHPSATNCELTISLDMSASPYGVGRYSVSAQVFYSDRDIGPFIAGQPIVVFGYKVIA